MAKLKFSQMIQLLCILFEFYSWSSCKYFSQYIPDLLVSLGKKVYVAFVFKLTLKDGSPSSTCSSSPKLDWMIKKGMVGAKCLLHFSASTFISICFFFVVTFQFAFF